MYAQKSPPESLTTEVRCNRQSTPGAVASQNLADRADEKKPAQPGAGLKAVDEKLAESHTRLLQAAKILANGAILAALKARESATVKTPTRTASAITIPAKAVQL